MFARHCDARGVNDVSLNTACPQPTRQPEAITSGLISDNDALDLAPGLTGFIAPTMQELQQRRLVGIEPLERLALDARDNRCNEPLRLAHLEQSRLGKLAMTSEKGPHAMVRLIARVVGVGVETADMLVNEVSRVTCAIARPSLATPASRAPRMRAASAGVRGVLRAPVTLAFGAA